MSGNLDEARGRLREQADQLRLYDDRTLSEGDVEAIAEATARKLAALIPGPPIAAATSAKTFGLVGAHELAEQLGVEVTYVYRHAEELGGMRLGSGPRARMRFDLDSARQVLEARRRQPRGRSRKAAKTYGR